MRIDGERRKYASDIRVQDPLSSVTRNERKMLLFVSAIGITMVKIGLVPDKITALGIEFSQTNQLSLMILLVVINIYFLAAFLSYASSDYAAWKLSYYNSILDLEKEREERDKDGLFGLMEDPPKYTTQPFYIYRKSWIKASRPISAIRAVLEFIVPVIFSIYSIVILLRYAT
jgi:hypothetical protein